MYRNKNLISYKILPFKICKELPNIPEIKIDYRSYNNCLNVCGTIIYKQFQLEDYNTYVPLSSVYWKKVIGSHYKKYINALLSHKIIERSWGEFEIDSKILKLTGYRINPDMLDGQYDKLLYRQSKSQDSSKQNDFDEQNVELKKNGINPEAIRIQKKEAIFWINENAETIIRSNISLDYYQKLPDQLTIRFLKTNDKSRRYVYVSIQKAFEIADKENLELFHYKGKDIIGNMENFIQATIPLLIEQYNWSVYNIDHGRYNFNRHREIRRVYSSLVSLPSPLLQFIRINNQYIMQADLKCSQFTILANLIRSYIFQRKGITKNFAGTFMNKKSRDFIKHFYSILDKHKDNLPDYYNESPDDYDTGENDITKFLDDVFFADFYERIKDKLNLPLRDHAKVWAFTVIFGNPSTNNLIKQEMKRAYPTLIQIIDNFKKQYSSNKFPIGLQVLEAEIFIDNIWKCAKSEGITSFTRHDSILYPFRKNKEISNIIDMIKEKFNMLGSFKYETFNPEEVENWYNENFEYYDEPDMLDIFAQKYIVTPSYEYDEDMKDIINKLLKTGIKPCYFNIFDEAFLESILQLPFLKEMEKSIIETEIINLRDDFSFFQDETNSLIRKIIGYLSN
ncbi:MAG: hypothetical protein ACOCWM_04475 [Cyclobacteriaceae bacterium]